MKIRTAIKKEKRRYVIIYKKFRRFASTSPQYKGQTKEIRRKCKFISIKVRRGIVTYVELLRCLKNKRKHAD